MTKGSPKWAIRETIRQYEQSHNSRGVFFRKNKVVVFGKAVTDIEWHHNVMEEDFFSVTLEVQLPNAAVEHIPVLISGNILANMDLSSLVEGAWVEVAGQFRSYDILVDGSRQLLLFVFAKDISCFVKRSQIKKRIGENSIFLDGYITEYPIFHFISDGKDTTELILAVPGKGRNLNIIPCTLYGTYARLATTLKRGDYLSFYGQIHAKESSDTYYPYCFMKDYCTSYHVSIIDVVSSPMFTRKML